MHLFKAIHQDSINRQEKYLNLNFLSVIIVAI